MAANLLLGPILGLERDNYYTVVFVTDTEVVNAEVQFSNDVAKACHIGAIAQGVVWRAETQILPTNASQHIPYTIACDGQPAISVSAQATWAFYVPAAAEKPVMVYASCNGFSDLKLMNTTKKPYALWEAMKAKHAANPISLMLLGGDQLYADSIWSQVDLLKAWNSQDMDKKTKAEATDELCQAIDHFYSNLYLERWNQQEVAEMLASIPSLMMWDDHDIFDGWGSYPEELTKCAVYQTIYKAAKKHFELLQVRGLANRSLINISKPIAHYAMSMSFNKYTVIALDHRSQRTIRQIMADDQWNDFNAELAKCTTGDLLLLSAVPVVYRDFAAAESLVDSTPWEEEITDDLKDHWRAKEHQGERQKLIMRLLDNAVARKGKTAILSGDVHVGCLGVIRDHRDTKVVTVHQVVSSGIVHPAPTYIQWLGITSITNDNTEYLDENKSIAAEMLKPYGSNKYIRERNFVTLCEGTDNKLWVSWIVEGKDKPEYPLAAMQ